jgi:uncharacterized protein YyaL (SSP411 family)
MTVIMTPDGRPFYGGTYYPPVPRYNMPSFRQVLEGVVDAWLKRRQEIEASAGKIAAHLSASSMSPESSKPLSPGLLDQAVRGLRSNFDSRLGGFGSAPKFPPSMSIEFLLRRFVNDGDEEALLMAEKTLEKMATGGMYDQLGGGFARYSTDAAWLVPHFEKMLYDNALLSRVYLHAWQVTNRPLYRRIAEETLEFVAREMRHADGGFFSSYDADSEGVEGKFYVWNPPEIEDVLAQDAGLFKLYYDVTDEGNWEGNSILNVPRPLPELAELLEEDEDALWAKLDAARKILYAERAKRVWPGLDDKIVTSWNGLMLASFAEAGRLLKRSDFTEVAVQNARFLRRALRLPSGRLLRTWKDGTQAKYNAYLEDYAYLADGLLALYQNTHDGQWYSWSKELGDLIQKHFTNGTNGMFYDTSDDHEKLINRPVDLQDNAVPSASGMAVQVYLKLSLLMGDGYYRDVAERALNVMGELMARYPGAFSHWLSAASFAMSDALEVAIVGENGAEDTEALLAVVNNKYRPNLITAVGTGGEMIPLLQNRQMLDGQATAYVCRRFVCRTPVASPLELAALLP